MGISVRKIDSILKFIKFDRENIKFIFRLEMARTLKRARAQAVKKNDKDTKKKPTKTIDGSKVPALGKRHSNRTRVQAALHQAPNFLVLFWKFHFCSVLVALEEGIIIAFSHPVVDLTLLPLLSLSLSNNLAYFYLATLRRVLNLMRIKNQF